MVLCSVVLVLAALVLAPTAVPAQVLTVTPGDTVVSQMAAGRIVAISPDNQVRELATGLSSPRGVAVLADGSILVAELGKNRIVGIGGRYGTGPPTEVVSVPFPEGLTVNPAGEVFATALQAGEMGRVDLDAGTFTPIARDLEGPGDVAVRGIAMFVTESGPDGRVVSSVGANGQTAEFADGFNQPIGLAFGPGTLFVADFGADRIVQVDAQGNTTTFAELQDPSHLAIEPWIAAEGEPFTLSVTSTEGVVRFDSTGARIGVTDLPGAAGIATVPGTGPGGTPGPTVATTAPAPTTSAPTSTTQAEPTESAPATTRPPRTTTSLSEEEGAPSSTSGGILLASIIIIALIVVGGAVFAVVQRPKSGDKSGFEERPLDTNTVALAFGACAAEEVELAEAEGALASLEVQSESAAKRLTTAEDQVVEARAALVEARRSAADPTTTPAVARTASPEPAADEPAPTPSTGLRLDDLQLTTAAGRAALDAFLKREIEADELEEMWRALGEDRAIEVVRSARPGAEPDASRGGAGEAHDEPAADDPLAEEVEDADGPEPEPLDEVGLAEARLAEAEEDVAHAHAEIERLLEREAAARGRISAARAALDACQDRHRAELDAEAAASIEAATVAAASARPAPPPDPSSPPPPPLDPADVLPPLPDRPPLTPDAATVAALRRPKAPDAPADPDPSAAAPNARRDGLDRGMFIDDHGGGPGTPRRAAATFPDPDPEGDPDAGGSAAPPPARPAGVQDDPSLSDLLFQPSSDPAAPVDPTDARLDDLVFAWPASDVQKLAVVPTDPKPAPEPEPEPEPGDDEPPRPDLDFL